MLHRRSEEFSIAREGIRIGDQRNVTAYWLGVTLRLGGLMLVLAILVALSL